MNSTPEISLIDLFLTSPCPCTNSAPEVNSNPRRMSPRTLDRSIDWIAGHAGQNVQLIFQGSEDPSPALDLIERAASRCRKWEVCHPVHFTLTLVIHSLALDEQLAAKLAAWNVEYLLSSDEYGAVHHGFCEGKCTDRSLDIMQPRFSIDPEGTVFACGPEQDGLLLGDVFKGLDFAGDFKTFWTKQEKRKTKEEITSSLHFEKKSRPARGAIGVLCILLTLTIGVTRAEGVPKAVDPIAMTVTHNQWRVQVDVPALAWSDNLAAGARNWAEHLAKNGCLMKHSTGSNGENIYWAGPLSFSDGTRAVQGVTGQDVVDAWGSETTSYDYASNSCHGVCGHYTQVVWKSSREVGCGMTVCGDQGQIWVCRYSPAGNIVGQRPY